MDVQNGSCSCKIKSAIDLIYGNYQRYSGCYFRPEGIRLFLYHDKRWILVIKQNLMFQVYETAFNDMKMGRASAFSVLAFAFIIVITVIMLLYMNKREVEL